MNVATWNVRALLDRDESRNAERRTAIVARELARYNVDIAALSETRLSGENQLSDTRFSGRARLKERKEKGEWASPFELKSSSSLSNLTELVTGLCV